MNHNTRKFSCIILAGGEGKRVDGVDKGLLEYKGRPLIEHVINAVTPQVDDIVISANRNAEQYKLYSPKVISDQSEQYLGPLAGISAALGHCRHEWILIVACDTPFLPSDIIDQFLSTQSDRHLYIASTNGKPQLVLLLHRSLHDSLQHSLNEGKLRLMQWVKSHQPEIVTFEDETVFRNFNTPDDFNS